MRDTIAAPRGRVRAYRVPGLNLLPAHWLYPTAWQHNDILYEWGTIVGNLLLKQGLQYGIGGMFFEFENVADSDDAVSSPTVNRDPAEGVEYYNGLADSADRDYLRVPLIAGLLNSSDEVNFPNGNTPTFFAQTTGVAGVHGKPFSDASNSKVFGGALVAFVDNDDPTRDLVLSRFYFDPAAQQVKLSTSQIGLEWQVILD